MPESTRFGLGGGKTIDLQASRHEKTFDNVFPLGADHTRDPNTPPQPEISYRVQHISPRAGFGIGMTIGVGMTAMVLAAFPFSPSYHDVVWLTQDRLADTMRRVEFHKVETGVYPQKLEEVSNLLEMGPLVKGEKFPVLRPMLQPSMMDPTTFDRQAFFYERRGDGRYHLLATGADGRPFTGDDIHPRVKETPGGTLGLVTDR